MIFAVHFGYATVYAISCLHCCGKVEIYNGGGKLANCKVAVEAAASGGSVLYVATSLCHLILTRNAGAQSSEVIQSETSKFRLLMNAPLAPGLTNLSHWHTLKQANPDCDPD